MEKVFGEFEVKQVGIPCDEHEERVFDWDEGWKTILVDEEDVWQVSHSERLPNGHRLERTWNFPCNEHGRRRALATAWRLSQGENIPAHDEAEWR